MSEPWDRTAIVGIGATEFSAASGRSELRLAVEAISAAVADAGLTMADVDGLVTFDMDSNDPAKVANAFGLPGLTWFAQSQYGGGGGCSTIMGAAMAVASGAADVVVAYRAMNERSGRRFGQARVGRRAIPPSAAFTTPYGIHTAAQSFALPIARWFHETGLSNADVAPVSVAARRHAATNPNARFYGRPITIEDHEASRWIVEPVLKLLDCCLESDGAVAVVVTSAARAAELPQPPVRIIAAAQGLVGRAMADYYRDRVGGTPEIGLAARQVWEASGMGPSDVQLAILYDHFAPMVLMQLEDLGFCRPGEAGSFVADGAIEVGGRLPVNTHGGLIGEAYIHGMNGVAEAVRQLRGSAVNQVADAEHAIVTSGPGVPTGALLLGRAG